jgi:mycoredoxin
MTESATSTSATNIPHFTMYTTSWCHHCLQTKDWLKKKGLEPGRDFTEINIEEDESAAAEVEKLNDGYRSVPTILMPDGSVYREPTLADLGRIFAPVQQ